MDEREEAFEQAYRQYRGLVYTIIRSFRFDPATTEDVVQEAFLRAWRAWGTFDPDRLKSWLARITLNVATDFKRKRFHRQERPAGLFGKFSYEAEFRAALPEAQEDVEGTVVEREQARLLRQMVRNLPPIQKQVIWLRYFEGRTYMDIARKLRIPQGTVRSRLDRGRTTLVAAWLTDPMAS